MVLAEILGALGIREDFLEESLTEIGHFCPDLVCCKCLRLSLLLDPRELGDGRENLCVVLLDFTEMERVISK